MTMDAEERTIRYIILSRLKGFGPVTQNTLLDVCGSLENSFRMTEEEIADAFEARRIGGFNGSGNGQNTSVRLGRDRIRSFVALREQDNARRDAENIWRKTREAGIKIIVREDENYPKRFRGLADIPILLYTKGNLRINDYAYSVGIVGARKCSREGKEATITHAFEAVTGHSAEPFTGNVVDTITGAPDELFTGNVAEAATGCTAKTSARDVTDTVAERAAEPFTRNIIDAVTGSATELMHEPVIESIRSVDRQAAIISGMARGIDAYAHTAAIKSDGYTVAVLGNGPDICYPKEHIKLYEAIMEKGCILSEYPPGTEARQFFFPARNRLIAALSDTLYVIEAGRNSGTASTVSYGISYGRKVVKERCFAE